jgi:alanine adding enzyme
MSTECLEVGVAESKRRIEEITAQEFDTCVARDPRPNFAQSPQGAKLRELNGWKTSLLGLVSGEGSERTIDAAFVLSVRQGKLVTADISSGPLMDFTDDGLIRSFTEELSRHLATLGCVFVTINPNILRDDAIAESLKSHGWKHSGWTLGFQTGLRGNIRFAYVKDLTDLTLENYRDSYASRYRRYVRHVEKVLRLRRLGRDELPQFIDIMNNVAERKQFGQRSADYFYGLFDAFGDQVHFLVAENADGVRVSGIVFIENSWEMVAAIGGAVSGHEQERGNHLLHDHMIKTALEHGLTRYNFYGIEGRTDDPSSEGYGVYEFKTRFGTGFTEELIGEFTLPVDKLGYLAFRATTSLSDAIHHTKKS